MNATQSEMTDEELIDALRKEVSAWFSNVHLLEFEELLRRYDDAKKMREMVMKL